ncbi:phosphoribosyltransferase [Deinococcus multiflagellatus]|uniref:Phosphoribosyltransferase n=1 Tax=Deinococcus multiflagellatus TaxID=1656887 RepID=A0ABW1ZTW0_9DEIO|nr:phosphoribosyltransferase [Deinococcus multiflagellatus]MBZ9715906.1 phosphoribosyltransferase [Deinococcus multiflagellatus]
MTTSPSWPHLPKVFQDRTEAGQLLGAVLAARGPWPSAVVLALPRGGVPVAAEVARALGAPLDVFLVRKLGLPMAPEVAMGALASGGAQWLNEALMDRLGISAAALAQVQAREAQELARREALYRAGRGPLNLTGRTALLVDDGLATGATMRAAVQAARLLGAGRIVVAVPVAPPDTCADLHAEADEVVCLHTPPHFQAVGQFYGDFSQATDAEVLALLAGP